MDHRKAEFDNFDSPTVLQTLRNTEAIIFGIEEIGVRIPVGITFDGEKNPRQVLVPIGGDGESIHIETSIAAQGPSTITMIGEIAAETVGYDDTFFDVLTADDAEAHEELDNLFDEWGGEYGGFLRTVITIDLEKEPGRQLSGEADFAIVETKQEFETFSHETNGGVRAFAQIDQANSSK